MSLWAGVCCKYEGRVTKPRGQCYYQTLYSKEATHEASPEQREAQAWLWGWYCRVPAPEYMSRAAHSPVDTWGSAAPEVPRKKSQLWGQRAQDQDEQRCQRAATQNGEGLPGALSGGACPLALCSLLSGRGTRIKSFAPFGPSRAIWEVDQ